MFTLLTPNLHKTVVQFHYTERQGFLLHLKGAKILIGKGILRNVVLAVMACALLFSSGISGNAAAAERKYNMSYIYFGDSSSYVSHVDDTGNSLDEISPNYFNIGSNGGLELTDAINTDFINEMHERGILVVPFLSNHWDREKGKSALDNRKELVKEIAEAVEEYDLDGIHVDIENMTEEERDEYTDFVRLLNEELPSEKTIAVAVAPNPFWTEKGWQGSYDYKSLGKYSDYLMIMAYDEHYQGGTAGPVASLTFVEKSIQYALEKVPKEKIVLGIPFYGRYWENGKSYGGYGVSNAVIEKLIQTYNGKVELDKTSQSAKAVITIKAGDEKPTVAGKKLEAGTYTFWYENEESIKAKLNLVNRYDIKGTGSWSLGQEADDTWDYYSMWLNGYDFGDTEGHWAQEYILSMLYKGWMKGTSDNSFSPNNALTRAEAAVILVRALGLQKIEDGEAAFSDISKHWAKEEIEIAAQNKLILGSGDGKFHPDDLITRQEMAVLLDRVLVTLEDTGTVTNPYKDVSSAKYSWSYDSIMKLTDYGIFTGGADGFFKPLNKTTRAEMAALMDRITPYLEQTAVTLAAGS